MIPLLTSQFTNWNKNFLMYLSILVIQFFNIKVRICGYKHVTWKLNKYLPFVVSSPQCEFVYFVPESHDNESVWELKEVPCNCTICKTLVYATKLTTQTAAFRKSSFTIKCCLGPYLQHCFIYYTFLHLTKGVQILLLQAMRNMSSHVDGAVPVTPRDQLYGSHKLYPGGKFWGK